MFHREVDLCSGFSRTGRQATGGEGEEKHWEQEIGYAKVYQPKSVVENSQNCEQQDVIGTNAA